MPTLFERVDEALSGTEITAKVTIETEHLTGIATTLAGLISDPPQDFGDFLDEIAEAPLPDLELGGNLAVNLEAIREALPDDVSDIPGSLLAILSELEDAVGLGLTNVLERAIAAVQAIVAALSTDLSCGLAPGSTALPPPGGGTDGGAGSGGGSGGSGSGGSGGGSGGTTPERRVTPEGVDHAIDLLDALPSPLNVASFLGWLNDRLPTTRLPGLFLRSLPFFDDIRDPLGTLLAWEAMAPDDIRDQLSATLSAAAALIGQKLDEAIQPLVELEALSASFGTTLLAQVADDLAAGLADLRAAIDAADVGGTVATVTALDTLLDQYDAFRGTFESNVEAALDELDDRLPGLADEIRDQMHHVVSVLQPSGTWGKVATLGGQPIPALPTEVAGALTELRQVLDNQLAFFTELVDLIDFTALQAPIGTVLDEARGIVDGLEEGMVTVTLEIKERFADAEELLDQVDTTAIVAQAEAAIDAFKDELLQGLTDAFAPVRTAIEDVISAIDGAVDSFDPESLIADLQATLDAIVGVFEDPDVVGAIDTVRDTLDRVATTIGEISFAPLVDEVVAAIEELAGILSEVDTDALSAPLQLALKAALEALPGDLRPVTDPLIEEFGEFVDSGPVQIVETVKAQPQKLLDQLTAFEPGTLVGGISQPYNDLLDDMEAFAPSQLVDRLGAELDAFKDRLRQSASPGAVLEPVAELHAQLMEALDGLDPAAVVEPLQEGLDATITKILEAAPIDEILEPLDQIIGFIEHYLSVGDRFVELLRRVRDLLTGFEASASQMDAWLDGILGRVESLADVVPIQSAVDALGAAIDATQSAAIDAATNTLSDAVETLLAGLDPAARLTSLVQAWVAVPRGALEALPDSSEKAAIVALLDRFDPTDPSDSKPYSALADLEATLATMRGSLAAVLADWDERFHGEDAFLPGLREPQVTGARLRELIEETVTDQFHRPMKAVFLAFEAVQGTVASFVGAFEEVLGSLQAKLADLLLGPDSIAGIRDVVNEFVDQIRAVDLGFLTSSLQEVFDQVKAKLEALDPALIQEALDEAFEEMVDGVDLDLAIPPASLEPLDDSYQAVIDKLRALDPEALVTSVVQPAYDETVLPLVESIDLTPTLDALTGKLDSLDEELRDGMDRVNEAYQALLRAVPDVSVSIDVGISF